MINQNICECGHEKKNHFIPERDNGLKHCGITDCPCKKFEPVLLESPKDTMYRKLLKKPQNQSQETYRANVSENVPDTRKGIFDTADLEKEIKELKKIIKNQIKYWDENLEKEIRKRTKISEKDEIKKIREIEFNSFKKGYDKAIKDYAVFNKKIWLNKAEVEKILDEYKYEKYETCGGDYIEELKKRLGI